MAVVEGSGVFVQGEIPVRVGRGGLSSLQRKVQPVVQYPSELRVEHIHIAGMRRHDRIMNGSNVFTERGSPVLILHLEGRPFAMPDLVPFSPVKDMDDEIAKEQVSAAEARAALGI